MNFITYKEAAAIHNVSILTVCKAIQDYRIPIKARKNRIYVDAECLSRYRLVPIKQIIEEALR